MDEVGLRENGWRLRIPDVGTQALLSSDEIARLCKLDG